MVWGTAMRFPAIFWAALTFNIVHRVHGSWRLLFSARGAQGSEVMKADQSALHKVARSAKSQIVTNVRILLQSQQSVVVEPRASPQAARTFVAWGRFGQPIGREPSVIAHTHQDPLQCGPMHCQVAARGTKQHRRRTRRCGSDGAGNVTLTADI